VGSSRVNEPGRTDLRDALIRPMADGDQGAADAIMRSAFGTFLGLPDPRRTFGDAQYVRPRFAASPGSAFVAELDGQVVGSIFAARWGSFAFFGPLTVRADLWDRGIARRLMVPVIDIFEMWGVRLAGLHTFANSAKHVGLYQRFDFWPQYLTAIMSKPVAVAPAAGATRYSTVPSHERANVLIECAALTDAIFPGLDLSSEITSVFDQRLGDTVLVADDRGVAAFAVCHCGAGEAGSAACFVKFAAVRPGGHPAATFDHLLDGVERLAADRGVAQVTAGMNTARRDAYRHLLGRGFRTGGQGVRMHRPDDIGYCRSAVWVIDDLR
jgi:predicted N-acetyltransferase YhbS